MPAWIGPAQKAVVKPKFVRGATFRPSIPMCLGASKSTSHLTICLGHIRVVCRFSDAGTVQAVMLLVLLASEKRQGTKSREVVL